jgi:hypothetical protein
MRRSRIVAVAALALTGCAPTGSTLSVMKEPDTVCAPLQSTRDLWATVRTIAGNRIALFEAAGRRGALSPAVWAQGQEDIKVMRALDFDITRKLNSPKAVLDVEKVTKILEVSAKIIGALAP